MQPILGNCVCAQHQYQKLPVVLVFVISRFSSVRNHTSTPLQPFIIALSSFLIDEQPSLLTHTNQPNVTIRKLYVIAKRSFDEYLSKEDTLLHKYTWFNSSVKVNLSTALSLLHKNVPTIRQRKRTEQVLQEGLRIAEAFTRQLQSTEDEEDDHESEAATSPPPSSSMYVILLCKRGLTLINGRAYCGQQYTRKTKGPFSIIEHLGSVKGKGTSNSSANNIMVIAIHLSSTH
ncbi:predicted protein [Lichtheimia corymbifera JMRC:FSU:9682]|uniref:Uncharacterized protein n=1 Tax=Lichtheimia corymbifera JMRC:FSU:9682 TaxID=1263082 RepID=A0A068RQH1_9FUNG|nr:predicted protein [Lichtheimia corymbifera JMRC:FSU:9682]